MTISRQRTAARPNQTNTCAVIITFHPDEGFVERLTQVASQFPKVFIVDNGSNPISLRMLQNEVCSPKVFLIKNQSNRGIAAALNQGTRLAKSENFDWVVTLDQDTDIYPGFFSGLLDVYNNSGNEKIVVGSNYDEPHKSKAQANLLPCNSIAIERKTLITSGMLLPLEIFERIGQFREDYFIDSVDHEFSLRARANGYRMLISCKTLMRHSIGNTKKEKQGFKLFLSYHHPPKRKYYISRNTVFTAIRYFSNEPAWSIRQGWRMLSDLASIILLENDKSRKIKAFLTGVLHGFRGKMGPIEEAWPNGDY